MTLARPAAAGAASAAGPLHRLTPATAGWTWTSLDVDRLPPGGRVTRAGDGAEVLVLVLEGAARVTVGERAFDRVGGRASVFDDAPAGVVLAAPGEPVAVEASADGPVLLAIASAPGGDVRRTARVDPATILSEVRGAGPARRVVRNLLGPAAEAGRLIAVEAYTPGGNWSSYPPHKHDTDDPPNESQLEELYLYRFAKPGGFALQRVYTADRSLDEAIVARDLDLVLVPRGYHVVGAAAGYDCWYLNVMAGPERVWRFTVDPEHRWLMDWDPARPQATS
ncbi:MAG: 5-deoxy-glucuronate isomerase [Chloroflexota bacterium]